MYAYIDLDGTLTQYDYSDYDNNNWIKHPEILCKPPVIKSIPNNFIIFSKVTTPEEAILKQEWVDKYFPNNLLLTTYGPKDLIVDPHNSILISDYKEELNRWISAGGIGIKMLNGINSPSQTMYSVPQTDSIELVQQDDNSFAICFETPTECYKYYIEGEIK